MNIVRCMLLYYMFFERHNLSLKVVFQFQSLMSLTVHLKQESFISTADSQFLEKKYLQLQCRGLRFNQNKTCGSVKIS